MPIIVTCPSCAGQLRVSDDLIGRKVRCPACNTIFASETPAAQEEKRRSEPAPAVETEPVDAWKTLHLELDEPAQQSREAPTETKEDAPPPPAVDEPAQPAPRRRARLNDEHEDLGRCPACGRLVRHDARRCNGCGERLGVRRGMEEDDDFFDVRRRDYEPHRGGFILTMGILSAATLFVCPFLVPIALIPGLIAWILGARDLREMRAGRMDPSGRDNTQAGWICGIIGTLLNTLLLLTCGTILGLSIYADAQRGRNQNRPGFNPPPVVK